MDVDMWEVGPRCDSDCQCDGLIPESFRIHTARSSGKRHRERTNMNDGSSPLARSPYLTPSHRTILGRVENSPRCSVGKISRLLEDRRRFATMDKENVPDNFQHFRKGKSSGKENQGKRTLNFLETRSERQSELFHTETTQTNEFFRTETFSKTSEFRSETLTECRSFFRSVRTEGAAAELSTLGTSPVGRGRTLRKMKSLSSWTLAQVSADSPDVTARSVLEEDSSDSGYPPSSHKPSTPLALDESTLDFTHALTPTRTSLPESLPLRLTEESREKCETRVPGTELEPETEFDTLHDLEEEFEMDNFDKCTNYEIISTDSPNIISSGRSSRKITAKNLAFGAPIAQTERSTSFNAFRANPSATRMLNFDEEPKFEFTSPATIRPKSAAGVSVKKALKFSSETPKKNALRHERSDSSIGSMSNASPVSSTREEKSHSRLRLFNSESTNSMESGFASEVEDTFLFDAIEPELSSPKVANFGDLLSGQIKDQTLLPVTEETMDLDIAESSRTPSRPSFFRSFSLNPDAASIDKVRMSLFASSLDSPRSRGAKRAEPAASRADACKRRRADAPAADAAAAPPRRPLLQRAMSESCATIMSALARSASNPDLIGDFSLPYALPLLSSHHRDLKSISCETLAALLSGAYRDTVSRFQVIDCRYPYEYDGGHIRGARNLYTPEQMSELLEAPRSPPASPATAAAAPTSPGTAGRSILVLHCEFSQERGPKLYRYLRSRDRAANKESYPALRYPELYLLHGGYAAFVRAHAPHCAPAGYTPMQHPRHRAELARHRSRDERPPRQKCRSRLPL